MHPSRKEIKLIHETFFFYDVLRAETKEVMKVHAIINHISQWLIKSGLTSRLTSKGQKIVSCVDTKSYFSEIICQKQQETYYQVMSKYHRSRQLNP